MITKKELKKQLKNLPEKFSINELIEKLFLIEKIEKGIAQSNNGDFISDLELDNDINKWFN